MTPAPVTPVPVTPAPMTPVPVAPGPAEVVAPGPGYAGAVTRCAAYVVDLTVLTAAMAGGSSAVAFLVTVVTGWRLGLEGDRDLAGLGFAAAWLAYFAGSWALAGRTPGMALLGLRVTRSDGSAPVGPVAAVARAATLPLSVALFGLGFAGILLGRRRRALHDVLAGTAVVYAAVTPRTRPAARSGRRAGG